MADIPQASGVDEIMAYLFKASSGFFPSPLLFALAGKQWESCALTESFTVCPDQWRCNRLECVCVKVCTAVV